MMYDELFNFMRARESVFRARMDGRPAPWTNDPILQQYRFCNVHREDDKVTRWIAEHLREPFADDPDMWFLMAAARWTNWPGTLHDLIMAGALSTPWNPVRGAKVKWNRTRFVSVLKDRQYRGEKVWTGAYMIGTQGNQLDKAVFVADMVLSPMWERRAELRPRKGDSLHHFACRLATCYAMKGGFMTGQIIADVKNASAGPLSRYGQGEAKPPRDWLTWALSGPGSRRGMNRVMRRPVDAKVSEEQWHDELKQLQLVVNNWATDARHKHLHLTVCAQDLQNCLCEFDKYERVRLGEGRPRSRYPGK